MFSLAGDKLVHLKDFSISEPALCMARDDESVCVALSSSSGGEGKYIVLNIVDGKVSPFLCLLHELTTSSLIYIRSEL